MILIWWAVWSVLGLIHLSVLRGGTRPRTTFTVPDLQVENRSPVQPTNQLWVHLINYKSVVFKIIFTNQAKLLPCIFSIHHLLVKKNATSRGNNPLAQFAFHFPASSLHLFPLCCWSLPAPRTILTAHCWASPLQAPSVDRSCPGHLCWTQPFCLLPLWFQEIRVWLWLGSPSESWWQRGRAYYPMSPHLKATRAPPTNAPFLVLPKQSIRPCICSLWPKSPRWIYIVIFSTLAFKN